MLSQILLACERKRLGALLKEASTFLEPFTFIPGLSIVVVPRIIYLFPFSSIINFKSLGDTSEIHAFL